MPTTGTSAANSRGNRVHGMPVGHHDPAAVWRLLCLGMVFLVSHLGPHKRLSAGVLLPAAGRPRTGLGSRFRLDQYLHLAVRGPAPASAADQHELLHHLQHEHNDQQYDIQHNVVHHLQHDFNDDVIDDHHDGPAHNQLEHNLEFQHQHNVDAGLLFLPVSLAV